MSGGGSSGQNSTVTNQTVLPQFIQDAASTNINTANTVANRAYDSYSGDTVAGLTADQQAAYDYTRQNLGTASNTIDTANQAITGGNLATTAQSLLNPYLSNVESYGVGNVERSGALAQNNLAAQAASAGAFGGTRFGVQSGVLSAETARQAGDLSASIRSQGWDSAVSTALSQASSVSNLATASQAAGLQSASALSSAGAQEQNQNQADINAAVSKWQSARDYPLEQLAIQESALSSTPYGGTSTSTQPVNKGNSTLGALGGAASGAALGTSIMPGWGTAAGALIGGLGGYLTSR